MEDKNDIQNQLPQQNADPNNNRRIPRKSAAPQSPAPGDGHVVSGVQVWECWARESTPADVDRLYLKSLFEHFSTVLGPPDDDLHQAEVVEANSALHAELGNAKQRKLLLRLRDAEDARCEAAAYNGFVTGFRLAVGIAADLRMLPVYSYEDDTIERARKSFE